MDTITIPLGGRKNSGYSTIIDAADYDLAKDYKWFASPGYGGTMYAAVRLYLPDGTSPTRYLHRMLMGEPEGMVVDHWDRDGLNNCRSNLRIVTRGQNICNTRLNARNTTGYRGVFKHISPWTGRIRWQVRIQVDKQTRFIGSYDTPIEAATAYDAAAIRFHGAMASLNFPPLVA